VAEKRITNAVMRTKQRNNRRAFCVIVRSLIEISSRSTYLKPTRQQPALSPQPIPNASSEVGVLIASR